jgi:hypothetical protein
VPGAKRPSTEHDTGSRSVDRIVGLFFDFISLFIFMDGVNPSLRFPLRLLQIAVFVYAALVAIQGYHWWNAGK